MLKLSRCEKQYNNIIAMEVIPKLGVGSNTPETLSANSNPKLFETHNRKIIEYHLKLFV